MMFDGKVIGVGMMALVTSLNVPPEWANLVIGALITGLVSYIATKITQGQQVRETMNLNITTLQNQVENIEDRFDRLEDHMDAMWMQRHKE
jgi:uncharacterized membrane protein (DUF106 family)